MHSCFAKRLGRPTRADAERLSDQVLDAAARLFAERGYAETSIAAVAGAARVGKHTIYRRFPDKADLFRAVIDRNAESVLGGDEPPVEPGTGLARLRDLLERVAELGNSRASSWVYRVALAEAERFPELSAVLMLSTDQGLVARLGEVIAVAQADGTFPSGEADAFGRLALGMVAAPFLVGRLCGGGIDDDALFRAEFDLVWSIFVAGVNDVRPALSA